MQHSLVNVFHRLGNNNCTQRGQYYLCDMMAYHQKASCQRNHFHSFHHRSGPLINKTSTGNTEFPGYPWKGGKICNKFNQLAPSFIRATLFLLRLFTDHTHISLKHWIILQELYSVHLDNGLKGALGIVIRS